MSQSFVSNNPNKPPIFIGGKLHYWSGEDYIHYSDKYLNNKITNGIVIADFAAGVSGLQAQNLGANAALSNLNSGNPLTGGKSIKVTQGGTAANVASTLDINVVSSMMETDTVIGILGEIRYPAHSRSESVASIAIYTTTQASNFAGYGNATSESDEGISRVGGLSFSVVTGSALAAGGGGVASIGRPGLAFDRMRLRLVLSGGAELIIHGVVINPMSKPTVPIYFDDGWDSQYLEAFTYMARRGLVGTIGAVSSNIGAANYMTLAQAKEMYAAGWDFVNHTSTHSYVNTGYGVTANSGTVDHVAAAQTLLAGASFVLTSEAVFDAPRHLVFKSAANEQDHEFVITGIDENNLPTVERQWGRNATTWATQTAWKSITSVVSVHATTGTVSLGKSKSYAEIYKTLSDCRNWLQANGFTRAIDCYIAPGGETNVLLERVAAALGIKAIRLIASNMDYPFLNPRPYGITASGSGIAAGGSATTIAFKDKAIARMAHLGIYLHKIVPDTAAPTSIDAKVTDFRAVIDSIAADVRANKLLCPTMSEYVRMCNY